MLIIILQVFATYLNLNGQNNLFIFHIYTPLEFFVFTYILKSVVKSSSIKILLNLLLISFTLFCIYDMIVFETLSKFNSVPRGIEGILAIIFCIYFFFQLFISEESFQLKSYPPFWLFSGWLIYFSGTFFLFIYANHTGSNLTYPIIHSALNLILNLAYINVLWLGSRKSIS